MRKSYFLVPSWDLGPEDVVLGSVIANIKHPQRRLSSESLAAQIDTYQPAPTETRDISGTAKGSTEWNAGLFATFVQYVTVGGKISYRSKSTLEVKYSCERMETRRFSPSIQHVNAAAKDVGTVQHLKMGGFGATVFLITGVKTVYNVSITTIESTAKKGQLQVGLDIPLAQTTVGPKTGLMHEQHEQCTQTFKGPIVFAFEVEKIRVKTSGKVMSKQHISGAMLSTTSDGETDLEVEKAGEQLDEDEIDDLDVETSQGIDDQTGEACVIVTL
jgi:hypothetical protein